MKVQCPGQIKPALAEEGLPPESVILEWRCLREQSPKAGGEFVSRMLELADKRDISRECI
jgi:hypothetical protein